LYSFCIEIGYDDAINHRKVDNIEKAIERLCPDGIDIDFENVG